MAVIPFYGRADIIAIPVLTDNFDNCDGGQSARQGNALAGTINQPFLRQLFEHAFHRNFGAAPDIESTVNFALADLAGRGLDKLQYFVPAGEGYWRGWLGAFGAHANLSPVVVAGDNVFMGIGISALRRCVIPRFMNCCPPFWQWRFFWKETVWFFVLVFSPRF